MSKMSKSDKMNLGLVPKLRFPEFAKTGEWEEKTLGASFKISVGGDIDNDNVSSVKTAKYQYPIYANSLKHKGLYGFTDTYKISGESLTVTGRGSNIGNAVARYDKYYPIVRLLVLKALNNQSAKFFEEAINNTDVFVETTGIPQLTAPSIAKITIPTPSILEQEKISDCLSSLDDIISLEDKKHTSLKEHKKGLMQKLFPAEGKTVPELRFKEFQNSPNWEEKKLEDVCELISSGKTTKTNSNGKIPLIGSTGQIGYCDLPEHKGNLILVARVGANAGQVNLFSGECGVTDNTLVIEIKKHLIIYMFLYNWLNNFNLNKLVFGSGQPLVTGGQIKSLVFFLPKDIKEQEKIAECLSSLDDLISAQAEKIITLKTHKKYLMQNLFPAMSEVN